MPKFVIFFGNQSTTRADGKLNFWLKTNPNVRILSYQYQHARMGDHSICVMYEETESMVPDYDDRTNSGLLEED